MAPWVVVGVDSSVAWPTADTEIEFSGHKMTLRPGSKELMPTVAFEYPAALGFDAALVIVRRFLSSLAWVERSEVREEGVTGGSHPIRIGWPLKGNVITHNFRQDYLPAPQDRRARLALALYREALGLNSIAYAFLGFFKIINLVKKTGREQKDWINTVLPRIKDHRAVERKNELATTQSDLGAYLYESGRCAVAHAYTEPIADPEDVADRTRLAKDIPLNSGSSGVRDRGRVRRAVSGHRVARTSISTGRLSHSPRARGRRQTETKGIPGPSTVGASATLPPCARPRSAGVLL